MTQSRRPSRKRARLRRVEPGSDGVGLHLVTLIPCSARPPAHIPEPDRQPNQSCRGDNRLRRSGRSPTWRLVPDLRRSCTARRSSASCSLLRERIGRGNPTKKLLFDVTAIGQGVEEMLRSRIRDAIEIVLEEELTEALGSGRYHRTEARAGCGRGCGRHTRWRTSTGNSVVAPRPRARTNADTTCRSVTDNSRPIESSLLSYETGASG